MRMRKRRMLVFICLLPPWFSSGPQQWGVAFPLSYTLWTVCHRLTGCFQSNRADSGDCTAEDGSQNTDCVQLKAQQAKGKQGAHTGVNVQWCHPAGVHEAAVSLSLPPAIVKENMSSCGHLSRA